MGRLPATFQILSDDLSRHCVPLSPKGKAFYLGAARHSPRRGKLFISALRATLPEGKSPFIYYVNTYLVLFCSAIHFMDIVIWISIAPLYKTTSKFFHVKFFIVPLKLLDTLHKHGYNVECKIVWCRSRVLKIHRIGLQGFKPQSIISKEKYFSFRLRRKDSLKWGISPNGIFGAYEMYKACGNRQIRQNKQRKTKDNYAEKRVSLLYFGLCRPYI